MTSSREPEGVFLIMNPMAFFSQGLVIIYSLRPLLWSLGKRACEGNHSWATNKKGQRDY
jgi:hypothetical protein